MRPLSSLLLAAFICLASVALRDTSAAQTTDTLAPKTGTRLITLGVAAGPPPQAHRAQSSNLLIVNGALYVIDAGDGVARRLAKAGINLRDIGTISRTIMMITRRVLGP